MKNTPTIQGRESAKDQHQSSVSRGHRGARLKADREQKQAHKQFTNQIFPTKAYACFECKTRLTDTNRKRMAIFQQLPSGLLTSGFQLCIPCAGLFQSKQFHRLPNVNRDLLKARFLHEGTAAHVGGTA
ncbi:hypothetical protein NJI34_43920 [Pseudomonas sp. S 311-6]|jgi:uncharacterized protein YlaI|uniref:Uncharacterized protein n=1 Tax=Kerstersia gyiorum TaxID=206506 RepID=A0A4Q7MV46_9BURK|nr:hypothetical protein [Kerstersia gyiorum]KAB0543895.1 hypothetical protein F7P85_04480 [Kerstersia gyiorum]MCO7643709.1 hypothetical protein [Pseudomonas sp. S 311-6]RZS72851.1 hypothetical protein EV679_0033 [Kerstersia gyiorum]